MSPSELSSKLRELHTARSMLLESLVTTVRVLVPLLRDKDLPAMAQSVEEKLFALDTNASECRELLVHNPEAFIDAMRCDAARVRPFHER